MRYAYALVLGLITLGFIGATAAAAPMQPAPFPWERKSDKPAKSKIVDPLDRARRVLDRDFRRLKLPGNRVFDTGAAQDGTQPAPGATRYDRLDSDRDGFVSRGEYVRARSRPVRAGAQGRARYDAHRARLDSRFRAADRNGDGRLSSGELDGIQNRRF